MKNACLKIHFNGVFDSCLSVQWCFPRVSMGNCSDIVKFPNCTFQSFLCIVMEQLKRSQPSHMSANLPAGSKTTWNYESFKLSFRELFSTFIKLYRQRSGQEMMGKRCVPVPNSYRLYPVLQWLWHPVRFIQLVYVHILLVKCSLKALIIFLQTNSEFLLVPNLTALF